MIDSKIKTAKNYLEKCLEAVKMMFNKENEQCVHEQFKCMWYGWRRSLQADSTVYNLMHLMMTGVIIHHFISEIICS